MKNERWNWRPLGEIFDIGAGKTMSAAARTGTKKTPFLRTSNVFWDEIDLTVVDEMAMTPEEFLEKCVKAGDLLVCEGGEIGRAAIWSGQVELMSFQNHLHRLRQKNDEIEPLFYVYFLQCAFTQLGLFEGAGNKTTIPNLSRNRLAALEIPQPPLPEQQDIVTVLSRIRKALKLQEKELSLARELKASAMKRLFSNGLRGELQKETEIGLVPESWDVGSFGDVREWLQYGTSVPCKPISATYPVLRIPNIETGRVNPTNLKYCNMEQENANNYLLEPGDLLFIRTNGVLERLGTCAVYAGEPARSLFASYLIRARLKKEIVDPYFVSYFFGSELGTSLVATRATPAADGKYNLNTGIIDSLPLPIPPDKKEQEEIIEILDSINQKIELHKKKKTVLEQLFKSLLHKLMTGEIQASDINLSALKMKTEITK